MTWHELSEKINKMTDEQKVTDVTVFTTGEGEYYTATLCFADFETDQIDLGHPYLQIIN
jgi:hypothetical protein